MERTHDLTRGRGGVLSVSLEQLELVNGMQTVAAAVLPDIHYPPRLSRSFLERVAGRVDQVAVMAYDTELPADWLVGVHPEALRTWVRQAEIDGGIRPGTTTEESRRIAELEKEVRELRRANEILKAASAYFARELDPRLPR